ncbi:UNVERIFIED_CONTAM: hypothetical protein K2H54_033070 [Gekko kuhli]
MSRVQFLSPWCAVVSTLCLLDTGLDFKPSTHTHTHRFLGLLSGSGSGNHNAGPLPNIHWGGRGGKEGVCFCSGAGPHPDQSLAVLPRSPLCGGREGALATLG